MEENKQQITFELSDLTYEQLILAYKDIYDFTTYISNLLQTEEENAKQQEAEKGENK